MPLCDINTFRFKNNFDKLGGSCKWFGGTAGDNFTGYLQMVGLVAEIEETFREFLFRQGIEQVGGGLFETVIHTHIEGAIVFVAHTAGGIVDLHTRNAEVCENYVAGGEAFLFENLGDAGEIAAMKTDGSD